MMTADIPVWADVLASLLLVSGGLLALTSAFGLLRLPDLFTRMHGSTIGNTFGLGCVLLASIVIASVLAQRFVFQELLISLFVVTTSPVTSILLIRAGMYRDRRDASKMTMSQPSEGLKQIQRTQ
ncbi:MAG: monovalent cation/H(+) antiporter subunit G [Nitrosospira sp.]